MPEAGFEVADFKTGMQRYSIQSLPGLLVISAVITCQFNCTDIYIRFRKNKLFGCVNKA